MTVDGTPGSRDPCDGILDMHGILSPAQFSRPDIEPVANQFRDRPIRDGRPARAGVGRSASHFGARGTSSTRFELLMRWRDAGTAPWPTVRLRSPSSSISSFRRVTREHQAHGRST